MIESWLRALANEPAQLAAIGLALILAWPLARSFRQRNMPRSLWWLLPALAALLSWIYLLHYLRSGPRIIDATAYLLQARGLADGQLSFALSQPEASTLGRFLVRSQGADAARFSVIFPPGYPALLAVAVRAGVPLALGPLLAALVTLATMTLAKTVAPLIAKPQLEGRLIALSGCLSLVCAALRYHTADTMSHGAAALWWTLALVLLLRPTSTLSKLALGACFGALFATRPASALALLMVFGLHRWQLRQSRRARRSGVAIAWFALGAAAPLALWFAHQHTATGSFWSSAQGLYYALSDGPAECFSYGFGDTVGCRGEHGQFVAANLPNDFHLPQALATSGRRLFMHASDALNSGALLPIWLFGAWRAGRSRTGRLLLLAVAAQVLAYAPFYFDGNYPGGGARMYADVLPIEHLIAALGALSLTSWRPRLEAAWCASALVCASLLGFGLQRGRDHAALRDREGGWPMYQAAHTRALPAGALLFVDTDHGFNLARASSPRLHIARDRGDDIDWLRWQQAGQPDAYRYSYQVFGPDAGRYTLTPRPFSAQPPSPLVIEGESLWPPLRQYGAWVWPRHLPYRCVHAGKALQFYPQLRGGAVRLQLPQPASGDIELTLVGTADSAQRPQQRTSRSAYLSVSLSGATSAHSLTRRLPVPEAGACVTLRLPTGARGQPPYTLELAGSGAFALDALTYRQKVRHNQ